MTGPAAIEVLALSVVFWAAALPVVYAVRRSGRRGAAGVFGGAVLLQGALVLVTVYGAPDYEPEPQVTRRPAEIPSGAYTGSKTCQACHPGEYHSWHGSYHRTMTQVATPESVKGAFDGRLLENFGFSCRPMTRNGKFFIRMPDPEWAETEGTVPDIEREVVMVTGSHHMQVYWMDSGHRRIPEQVPFVYLVPEQRWIPRNSAFLKPLEPPNTEIGRWNTTCLNCHSTGPVPKAAMGKLEADTQVTEFGISCEACHGPAEAHVAAHRNPLDRYRARFGDRDATGIVHPAKLNPKRSAEVCGQCHAITRFLNIKEQEAWSRNGLRFRPGDSLAHSRFLVRYGSRGENPELDSLLDVLPDYLSHQFWSDGHVRVSGREYNGLVNTPCFTHGGADSKTMTCLSCHTMHRKDGDSRPLKAWADDQLGEGMRTNRACTQCHEAYVGESLTRHTRHTADSSGSSCYNCHMPHTTYGLLKAIRSHTLDMPSVATTLETGRPNACNQCHLDRTLQWTADHLQSWYGIAPPEIPADEREVAASLIWLYKGDAAQRALMAWSMGWDAALEASNPRWMPAHLADLLRDDYDAVRFIARRSLLRHQGFTDFEFDHMARPGEREKSFRQALDRWQQGYSADLPRGDHLLIGADGRPDRTRIEAFLDQRDFSPTRLVE